MAAQRRACSEEATVMFRDSPAFSGYSVDYIDAAKRFYRDTLGLEVDESMGGLGLTFRNGHHVFIYPKGPDHKPANYTVLDFPVDDMNAAVDWLTSRGVTMERYEGAEQDERGIAHPVSPEYGPTIARFKDPAGNIIAVLHQD
jgi:catechol 2,3-dioxygenase-like lactoylglutathione lyase family enzyme